MQRLVLPLPLGAPNWLRPATPSPPVRGHGCVDSDSGTVDCDDGLGAVVSLGVDWVLVPGAPGTTGAVSVGRAEVVGVVGGVGVLDCLLAR